MELKIKRKEPYPDRSIGGFYIDGRWCYYTLEDTDRKLEEGGVKIAGKTAIPRGRYKMTISWSNRFRRLMPTSLTSLSLLESVFMLVIYQRTQKAVLLLDYSMKLELIAFSNQNSLLMTSSPNLSQDS